MKPKVLFIMHMPPPVHGASMVGKFIKDSKIVNETYDSSFLNLSTSESVNEVGLFSVKKIFSSFRIFIKSIELYKVVKPSLVYVTPNSFGLAFFKETILVVLLRCFGAKILLHFHNKGVNLHQDKPLYNLFYRLLFHDAHVMLLADNLYSDISKYVPRDRVQICENGIPVVGDSIQKKSKDPEEMFHILYLSNMMKEKGVYDLLDACSILKQRKIKFVCDFVGGWKDVSYGAFQQYIEEHDLLDVCVAHGPKYGEEKTNYWLKADVFVLPTFYCRECFPLVLLEAMQYGVPCIATNEAGIPQIVEDGETGFLVPKHSPEAIATAIERLMKDGVKMKLMGDKGKEKFNRLFTIDSFENRFVKSLNTIIDEGSN